MAGRSFLVLVAMVAGGCAVGPDYERIEPALPETFTEAEGLGDPDSTPIEGLWQSLGNAELTLLIDRALANNTTIAQALATLNETRALSGLSVYSLLPTVGVSADYERSRFSVDDPLAFPGLGVVERYRAGFDAAWEIDLFGSLRRQAEGFRYLVEADEATVYAVELSIVAEVAQTYFQWQGESLRLRILEENLANQADSVAILEAGLEAGRGTAFDVARARAVERQIAAAVPLAEAAIVRAEQRLAVLARLPVDELRAELSPPTSLPALPPLVAVGTPEDWLPRRPDVRAAERRLAAATADIGVATAEFYPQLTLVGDFGWTGVTSSAIGNSDADRWRVAPGISWRILDVGRVRREVAAAEARADGALAAFEEAWLVALEETENALANYRATTERAARLEEAAAEAKEAARLARLRFDVGVDSFLAVLDAERTRIELEDLLAQARTDRATALAALFKALGGDFAMADRTR
ncbi:MAG: TolC family protein [Woeseiaceae bacterium]|jgi:multidrug efflux system outer membrane protein|nr:TolC family protein [Woeseiaceae bacterium]